MGEVLSRPAPWVSVKIPAQTITVSSALQLEILWVMSQSGLNRSSRIGGHLLTAGLAENENSVRNALWRLTVLGLIDDYRERGRAVGWTPVRGGGRRLVVLTETGRAWGRAAFGQQSAAPEVYAALERHQSAEHAIAVLEVCDYLRQAGYAVDETPAPVTATARNRWGRRTEPDLLAKMDGELWPVEVQREVSARAELKLEKSLALAGRLALVVFNEEQQLKQQRVLESLPSCQRALERPLRLANLESMQRGAWRRVQVCPPALR